MKIGTDRHYRTERVEEENPYWISFSDIMTGLLVVFILASLKLILDLTETKNKVDLQIEELLKIEELRANMLLELKEELARRNINVEIVDNDSVLRVPTDQLHFESNEYHIPPEKTGAVDTIGKILFATITKGNRNKFIDTIFVEGHTDSRPLNTEMGNWGLSASRAIEVWKHWQSNEEFGEGLTGLRNKSGRPMFSVSGYGATRRYIENDDTQEKMRQNRRIDIRFTMKQPNIQDLSDLKEIIGL